MKLDDHLIRRPKDILKAFVIAADLGGLEEKQAAAGAGMDPGSWSQFKNGERGIKPLALNGFLDQCGNELPLAYWAFSRGYSLLPLETELQKQVRNLNAMLDDERKKNAVLLDAIRR